MNVVPLGSGSGGNCYFVESEGTRVLVDAGFGPRETARRLLMLGESIECLDAVLITHEHSDHIHGAESISRKFGVPIWMTKGTLDASRIDTEVARVVVFDNNSEFRIGEISVRARRTIHDAADPACFVLESRDGARIGLASDLGYVDDPVLRHLSGCDALLFESNHDVDMLRSGTYPWGLKRRILSNHGHLSNDDAMNAVRRMIGPDTSALCLIHLSEKNNHESIVRSMAASLLGSLGGNIQLSIAAQRRPGVPIHISRRPGLTPPAPFRPAQLSLF